MFLFHGSLKLAQKIYHMWSITRLECTDEHSEATTGYLALKRRSFGCLKAQMSQVAKACGKCLIFFVGGGRAVQKIHALVHVCCFCVISVFDFVWLHHDCIMTASWQHHRIDLCGSNIMRKKTVVNATDAVCSKPQTARLPSETQSRFRGLDFSAFPDRTPHKKSWVCLKSMGKPLVKPLVNQNYPCHLTATATNHCWTHPTIILLYKGFHKWGYP